MAKPKKPKKIKAPKAVPDLYAELDALGPVADYPEGRIAWWRARVAIIDRHRKRSRMSDPEKLQEVHSPTVEIAVDDPDATRKARRNLTRCRQSEAWRHNQLTGMQREAEREMELTWRTLTVGLGAAIAKYGVFAPGLGGGEHELSVALRDAWRDWMREAARRRISRKVVLDCLTEPKTLVDIERERRLPLGRALVVYQRGLDLWCELRGWATRA